jgi:uncharacterized membrane protein YdjX (TVP38/TMEM64 family)
VPRRLLWRFGFFLVLLATIGFALRFTPLAQFTDQEWLLATLQESRLWVAERWWPPLVLILAFVVLCPVGFPITPFWIAGGVLFGVVEGALYNLVGTLLGAASSFYFARSFGRELIKHLMGDRLRPFEARLNRRGFWTLVGGRFLPIPFPAFNFSCALIGIRTGVFFLTSALGLSLPVFVWTWFWTTLANTAAGEPGANPAQALIALAPFLLLIFGPQLYTARQRKKRYREVMAARAERGNGD